MRLANYGAGEIVDRLSIISLKIVYGKQALKSVTHFEAERTELLAKLPQITTVWFDATLELAAVNAMMWQDTNRVRDLRKLYEAATPEIPVLGAVQELAHLAMRLQEMNDRRAILITFINVWTGQTEQGAEKQ